MITPIISNYPYKNNISFQAIPLAQYDYLRDRKKVKIYQLEEKDIGYLEHLSENLDKFYKKYDIDNESAKQVIEEAFSAGTEILKRSDTEKKARILMAFYDNEPSSILIGNALKVDSKGGLHYSSRKNHSKHETELDWLATWNKKIPGEGQATVYEYFFTLLEDGFKQCFVRAEIPEKSSAVAFYIRMGFEKLSEIPRKILRKNDYRYAIGKYDDKCDTIIPMKATVKDIMKIIDKNAFTIRRKEIKNRHSCTLPKENFN